MSRLLAAVVVAWTVLIGPALCVSGLLEHACDCGHGTDARCEHEDACASDPCVSATRPQDQEARLGLDVEGPLSAALPPALADVFRPGARVPAPRGEVRTPDVPTLPYAPSDRPLLN